MIQRADDQAGGEEHVTAGLKPNEVLNTLDP
jgi:hypothetical protein